MTPLLTLIEKSFVEAFKAKDMVKKNTLGIVKSRISEWKSDKKNTGKEILDVDIITILSSEVKKRNQAIDMYNSNGSETAKTNAQKEQVELDILKLYLPTQMSEQEIFEKIQDVFVNLNPGEQLTPNVMKHFNSNFKGQFDNKQLQTILQTFKN